MDPHAVTNITKPFYVIHNNIKLLTVFKRPLYCMFLAVSTITIILGAHNAGPIRYDLHQHTMTACCTTK